MEVCRTKPSEVEEWRAVEGFAEYEVSNWGKVRSKHTGRVVRLCKGFGMRRIALRNDAKKWVVIVLAQIVLEAFVAKRPAGHKAFCLDGNYEHCYVENLMWVQRKRNKYRYKRAYKYRVRIHNNKSNENQD